MSSRYGVIHEQDHVDLEVALAAAEALAEESRLGWRLRGKDQITLALAIAAERAVAAEEELAAVKRELAGVKLTLARVKKSNKTEEKTDGE